jgi:hypothetical protein
MGSFPEQKFCYTVCKSSLMEYVRFFGVVFEEKTERAGKKYKKEALLKK